MKTTIATAAAVLIASAISASAMTNDASVKNQLKFAGYDAAVVDALTDEQIKNLAFALHNGEDSDIRGNVASLMLRYGG